ncbi:MAG: diaminopimelate decarboxylase [Firmicutes bacterium]|nr:diaminopimelate decarboxylase [Bacillota bacterium]
MNNIKRDDNLIFGGCDTVELAKEYKTPLYVISEKIIRDRCTEIKDDFLNKYKNVTAVYASKAFLTLTMCKIIESEGLGLDVVSGGELFTAIKANFPLNKVIFHGNNKTVEELNMAIEYEVGRIVVDNLYELELIRKIAKRLNKKVKILYRITPGVKSDTHEYITTGQKDSKFGIPLNEEIISEAVKKGMKYEEIDLLGFHLHVGSQLFDNSSHLAGVEVALRLIKKANDEYDFVTKELNTGGGFGIYYSGDDVRKPLNYFTDSIMDLINDRCKSQGLKIPKVIIEPGRWIIGEAGITLYTIGSIKQIPNIRTYVAVDGGMTDNPRPALYGAKYNAVIANKVNKKKNKVVTIAGKCCESGDILIKDIALPKVESGDILAVSSTGAYNHSMANNYNKNTRPAVVLVNDGESELIVRRETYKDLLIREKLPSRFQDTEVNERRSV